MKQLITYFGLAYLISWVIWLPLYGHIFGLTNLSVIPFNHAIGGLGPLIASFLTTWFFLNPNGIKALVTKCFQIKPLIYLAIALFSPFEPICESRLRLNKNESDWDFLPHHGNRRGMKRVNVVA